RPRSHGADRRRAGLDAGRLHPPGRAEPAGPPAARGEPRDALHHPRPRHRPALLRRDPGDVPRRSRRARRRRPGHPRPPGGVHQAAAGRRARTRQQPPLPRRGPAPRRAHARPSRPRRRERVTPTRTPARRHLHEGWHLTITDGPAPVAVRDVPATVPGTLITDLHAAGLIEDPYLDRTSTTWPGRASATSPTPRASTGGRRE